MAEKLVFMAHQGKVTLREKFPAAGSRRMPDLPGAVPHLTYGYATFSPIVIAEQLKAARAARADGEAEGAAPRPRRRRSPTATPSRATTCGTAPFFPASDADNWLVAGSAAYWQILRGLPEKAAERPDALARAARRPPEPARLRHRRARPDVAAAKGGVAYDRYAPALVPRIKGAFALHQLRLLSGNKAFFAFMKDFHARHRGQEVTTAQFLAAARESLGRDVEPDLRPWLDRTGVPDPAPAVDVAPQGKEWRVTRARDAAGRGLPPRHDRRGGGRRRAPPLPDDAWRARRARPRSPSRRSPRRVVFDALADFPAATDRRHAFSSFAEDFARTLIVYGTGRQVEANHTLALRFQSVLADAFSEILPPVVQDAEVDEAELAAHDLFVLGDPRDNALLAPLLPKLPVESGPGFFRFQGATYADERDGLYLALPSPFAPGRVLHVVLANSPLQLHEMTKTYRAGTAGVGGLPGREGREGGALPGRALRSRGEVTA